MQDGQHLVPPPPRRHSPRRALTSRPRRLSSHPVSVTTCPPDPALRPRLDGCCMGGGCRKSCLVSSGVSAPRLPPPPALFRPAFDSSLARSTYRRTPRGRSSTCSSTTDTSASAAVGLARLVSGQSTSRWQSESHMERRDAPPSNHTRKKRGGKDLHRMCIGRRRQTWSLCESARTGCNGMRVT